MSSIKKFELRIIDTEGEVSTHVSIEGFSTLEILGIRSVLDNLVEDALNADDEKGETETKKENHD
jgi:hypothetical protein